ncbi:MAG: alpha-2-macroglobulin family protein [Myxococcota bacterium]
MSARGFSVGALVAAALVGCLSAGEAPMPPMEQAAVADRFVEMEVAKAEEAPPPPASAAPMDGAMGGARREAASRPSPAPVDARVANDEPAPDDDGDRGEQAARSWFPESFLWQPRLVTGDDGVAELDVAVPDSLTTWRVLALAHDRAGQQAGTVQQFQGTLPLYVDPVVPGWLYAGDRLLLPVQVVNTTADPLTARLDVEATGALSGSGVASVHLGAAGSDVRRVPLEAESAGVARISARLAGGDAQDAAEREIPVTPAGRPVEKTRAGTLAARRSFTLAPPDAADPRTDRLDVTVFPAPLALLQLELERLQSGARPTDPAYGFALAGQMGVLSSALGVDVDPDAMRRLKLLAWQRAAAYILSPDPNRAADLLASLRLEHDQPQVVEAVPLLAQRLLDAQRADGTWSRTGRSTLQQVLVQTAWSARALPEEEHGAVLRASAAVERNAADIRDGYTAAVVLASGLADGGLQEELLKRVRAGIGADPDTGEARVEPRDTVLNPWGVRPSRAEVLAFTVLALPAGDEARGDLAAALLRSWSPITGFGAGPADVVALEAVASALGSIDGPVTVTLLRDGDEVASGTLDPQQPGVAAVLSAEAHGDDSEFTVAASPELPGLAFVATRRSWVPWTDADRLAGVDLAVDTSRLRAGEPGTLTIEASAPAGVSLRIEQGLPSGVLVDDDAVRAVAQLGGTLEVRTDRVILTTRAFQPLEAQSFAIPVTPTFAGRFQTSPLLVAPSGAQAVPHRPIAWTVAP